MIGFINDTDASRVPLELRWAAEILRYLSHAGNNAAEQRLNDIQQFCNHVWATAPILDPTPSAVPVVPAGDSQGDIDPVAADPLQLEAQQGRPTTQYGSNLGDIGSSATGQCCSTYLTDFNATSDFVLDLNLEADGIYSSFHDPNLPLTGVDSLDWAEMDRIFTSKPT